MTEKKDENLTKGPAELLKQYIKEKSIVHMQLLDYLDSSRNEMTKLITLMETFQSKKQDTSSKYEFEELLKMMFHLLKEHQPSKELKLRIEQILKSLKNDIKSVFTEKELFDIFQQSNKLFLLTLFEQDILSVGTIIENISYIGRNCDGDLIKLFYPEIREHDEVLFVKLLDICYNYKLREFVEANDKDIEKFYEDRRNRESSLYIKKLIREDKIDEFISYIESIMLDLNVPINEEKSVLENHSDFRSWKLSPIEYSALFGSIKIFKYLWNKKVDIEIKDKDFSNNTLNNIMECAVQGRNYEIIHLLEDNPKIKLELSDPNNQDRYLIAAINCQHNEIFEYFVDSYRINVKDNLLDSICTSYNYQIFNKLVEKEQINFENKKIINELFFHYCDAGNTEIVKILIKFPCFDVNGPNEVIFLLWKKIYGF